MPFQDFCEILPSRGFSRVQAGLSAAAQVSFYRKILKYFPFYVIFCMTVQSLQIQLFPIDARSCKKPAVVPRRSQPLTEAPGPMRRTAHGATVISTLREAFSANDQGEMK